MPIVLLRRSQEDSSSWAMHAPCDDSNEEEEGQEPYAHYMDLFGSEVGPTEYIDRQEWEAPVLPFRSNRERWVRPNLRVLSDLLLR